MIPLQQRRKPIHRTRFSKAELTLVLSLLEAEKRRCMEKMHLPSNLTADDKERALLIYSAVEKMKGKIVR